jgi:hypothetical protein
VLFPLQASRSSVGTINHDREGALPQNGSEKKKKKKKKKIEVERKFKHKKV